MSSNVGGGGGDLSVLLVVTTVGEDTYKAFASWSTVCTANMFCLFVLYICLFVCLLVLYIFIAPVADTISQQ